MSLTAVCSYPWEHSALLWFPLPNLLRLSHKRYLPSTLHSGCLSLLAPFVEVKNQGAKERLVPDLGTERPGVVTL